MFLYEIILDGMGYCNPLLIVSSPIFLHVIEENEGM
jgi:hypothetical protein